MKFVGKAAARIESSTLTTFTSYVRAIFIVGEKVLQHQAPKFRGKKVEIERRSRVYGNVLLAVRCCMLRMR